LLTILESLNPGKNFLFGPIPMGIFKMSNLVTFLVEDCAHTQTIPTEIGQMTTLKPIVWSDNTHFEEAVSQK
jgi:hypothetical protein